jgi:hypothetical protein
MEMYELYRGVKVPDFAVTLRKLRVVDYVPPLGGRGGGTPIKEVVELEDTWPQPQPFSFGWFSSANSAAVLLAEDERRAASQNGADWQASVSPM